MIRVVLTVVAVFLEWQLITGYSGGCSSRNYGIGDSKSVFGGSRGVGGSSISGGGGDGGSSGVGGLGDSICGGFH